MSNIYKNPGDVPLDVICKRLSELAKHIANGDVSEFYMRIPAECDRDADIVLSEAVNRIKAMQTKIDAQAEELKALREHADLCVQNRVRLISAQCYGLIDDNGNPTPLLTGETPCKN